MPGTTNGDGAIRCVYLTNGATVSGFTLTKGATQSGGDYELEQAGGGVWCEASSAAVSNCVLAGNSAVFGGGGAFGGTLNNCTVTGNFTTYLGGGAFDCTLNNCILSRNSTRSGGGAATNGANYDATYSTLNYCCTTPQPTTGSGNVTLAPLFVNLAGGNLRLQSNSPCINAGNNAYAPAGPDLDGRSSIVGGTVDIGAYEFQPGVSGLFIGWLQHYGLPTDGSAD